MSQFIYKLLRDDRTMIQAQNNSANKKVDMSYWEYFTTWM